MVLADIEKPVSVGVVEGINPAIGLLRRPFHADVVRERKIGGRQVSYVPVDAVIDRLNKSCPVWNYRIVNSTWEVMKLNRWNEQSRRSEARDVAVYVVTGELEIPGVGTRQAQGVQAIDEGSGEDLLKGASTDALKKCATLFGVPVDGE
jgi:hypothetical protein